MYLKKYLTFSFFLLLLSGCPMQSALSQSEVQENILDVQIQADFSSQGKEILTKRGPESKTYLRNSDQIVHQIFSGRLHFRENDGPYTEIEFAIKPDKKDSNLYAWNNGIYQAVFAKENANKKHLPVNTTFVKGATIRQSIISMGYYSQESGQYIEIDTPKEVRAQVDELATNKIVYREIFPGVDVVYTAKSHKLKKDIIVKKSARNKLPTPSSLGLSEKDVLLAFKSSLSIRGTARATSGKQLLASAARGTELSVNYSGTKTVLFQDELNMELFRFGKDAAWIQNDTITDSLKNESRAQVDVMRHFFSTDQKDYVLVMVPMSWLADAPAGDLIIDPSVEIPAELEDGKDSFIYASTGGDDNFGASTSIQVGPDRGTYERRGIIKFDCSAVPENASIDSAFLRLYLASTWGSSNSFVIEAHQMLQDWAEGTASSWNNNSTTGCDWGYADQAASVSWNANGMQSGSDYSATVLGTDTVSYGASSAWYQWNVQGAVEDWIDGTDANHGIALLTASADMSDYVGATFRSSDYTTDAGKRPQLIIYYTIEPLAEYHYDALGRPDTVSYANGVKEISRYDTHRGWLVEKKYIDGDSLLFSIDHSSSGAYDKTGNLKKVIYRYGSTSTDSMEYDYDDLYRLIQFKHNGTIKKEYAYDANGNRADKNSESFLYANDNNQLTEYRNTDAQDHDTTTYVFDAIGRVDTLGGTDVGYDLFNNMTCFGSNTYAYDAFGQRIRKSENGDSTYYITSGMQILSEYNSDDELMSEYIYANGRRICAYQPDQGYLWYYTDHLGSTRRLDGSDMRRDYYPFGAIYHAEGDDDSDYLFTGKELDEGNGLYYFGYRFHESKIGRWTTIDPLNDYVSPYVYCSNNPLNLIDLVGLDDDSLNTLGDSDNPFYNPLFTIYVFAESYYLTVGEAAELFASRNMGKYGSWSGAGEYVSFLYELAYNYGIGSAHAYHQDVVAPHIKTAGKIALGAACFPSAVIAGSALQLGARTTQLAARVTRITKDVRLTLKFAHNLCAAKNSYNTFTTIAKHFPGSVPYNVRYWQSVSYISRGTQMIGNYGAHSFDFAGAILNPGIYPLTSSGVIGGIAHDRLVKHFGW
jgi:RHS repeat-associated protein